jgi:hypothetical protein
LRQARLQMMSQSSRATRHRPRRATHACRAIDARDQNNKDRTMRSTRMKTTNWMAAGLRRHARGAIARALVCAAACLSAATAALAASTAGNAGTTGTASAPLELDVSGKIRNTTDAAHTVYHFDQTKLLGLPVHAISTSTTWTPKSTFQGPALADILKTVGAWGSEVEVHTFDDYTYTLPISDAGRYGVVIAYSMNGKRLTISDFGPLFMVYPRDTYPTELTGVGADSKFIWQIKALVIR